MDSYLDIDDYHTPVKHQIKNLDFQYLDLRQTSTRDVFIKKREI